MKKQINPTIKAHLTRSVFYVLLLIAVCAIPFVLAQRNAAKRSTAKPVAEPNTVGIAQLAQDTSSLDSAVRASRVRAPTATDLARTSSPTGCPGLVVNGDFETGSLPPWINTGDTSFTGVDSNNPHSGTYELFAGPTGSDGFIDQVLPTVAGTAYDVSFWLENDDTSGNNRFGASFGSVTLVPEAVQVPFGYTQYTFTNVVPGDNADLHFIFYNPPSYFYLDDVCVTPSGGGGTPSPTPTPSATPTGSPTCTPGGLGTWQSAGSLTNARSRLGVAFFPPNGNFYALGGEGTGGLNNPIEEYNRGTNMWTTRANLMVGVSNTGAATVGNFIYVPGGFDGINARTEMQRYDPVANTVTTVAPLPAGNFAHAVAAQGTKIYVLGGSISGSAGTTNLIYDTMTDSWSMGAPLLTAVQYPAAASDGTYIYVLGGNTNDLNTVQRYDPVANMWVTRANMLQGRGGPGAFFDGTFIWAVGGGWSTYLTSTEYYNPVTDVWTAGPPLMTGARTVGAAFGNNLAVKAGGWNGNYVAVAEKLDFTPCPSPTPTATATATATPTPTSTPAGCVFGQGYWKNHPDQWPVTELELGNVTYTQQQLLDILHQPVRGNGLVLLAHQLIAAKLNIANGADGSCIQQTIADADALIADLIVPPVGTGYLAPRDVSALADTLDQYNEGMLCAPSCEENGSPAPTPTPRSRPIPAPRPRP